ncbi:hypothetical protein LCGC14_1179800 [marine sediment metagenome]|uniref:Uncharacterized protein n=1 Tax=marine sediment metagenome TaxID=412755 RepID=A0A0F9LSC6_9ZZZZ
MKMQLAGADVEVCCESDTLKMRVSDPNGSESSRYIYFDRAEALALATALKELAPKK